MKKIFLFAMGLVMGMTALAQDKVEATISGDLVSNYIWRGQDLTAWGSVGLSNSNDTKELDLTLSYTTGGFNIGITDYWFNVGLDPENRYFKYDAHGTNHVFEANIGYDFGLVSLQWYTNFAGNDGLNKNGKRAYSSYFEANVPFKLATVDWSATVGVIPYATSFYNEWTSGFSVTNIALKASKDIKITDSFSIPLFAQLVGNPRTQKGYFVLGFTLKAI